MQYEPRFDIFALFMVLGVFQGIFIAYVFLTSPQNKQTRNIFFGSLFITLVIISSEILLNYSGIIVRILFIENYSEPFVFLISPLVYLTIRTGLGSKYEKKDWIHFFPFGAYFIYSILYFIQPIEFKYNSFVYCYQPDWSYLSFQMVIPDDPLGLRQALVQLYFAQFIIYILLDYQVLLAYRQENTIKDNTTLKMFRKYFLSMILIIFFILVVLIVKLIFERDLGDYIIGSVISIIIYISSFLVVRSLLSDTKENKTGVVNIDKYSKSALSEEKKNEILGKLSILFNDDKYYLGNTISLVSTAKHIGEQTHHVSQVINEKLLMNFFDLIAKYRIEEAQRLLSNPELKNSTIEDIAEKVGYNSKAAFNKSFKKLTGKTPSEFRAR